jgi:hypothetical protein
MSVSGEKKKRSINVRSWKQLEAHSPQMAASFSRVAATHFKEGVSTDDVLAGYDRRRNGRGVGRFSRRRCLTAK